MASSLTRRVRLLAHSVMSLCLAIGVLLTTLTFTHTTHGSSPQPMSCCVGEAAGHCSSGIVTPEPPPEPTCHEQLAEDELTENEYETVVVEESESTEESTISDELPLSLTAPCATDCCALVWTGFKRPRRDFADLIHRRVVEQNLARSLRTQKLPAPVLASTRFNRSIPRGPPASASNISL